MFYALVTFAFYMAYEVVSIITFVVINNRLTPDSAEIIEWVANYNKDCGELDMTYSLQNACLNGCAYVTFPVFAYICTIYRNRLICTAEPVVKI